MKGLFWVVGVFALAVALSLGLRAVDGYALLYYLYFSNNFNCVCGGQYAQFAECTRAYISNLLKCG